MQLNIFNREEMCEKLRVEITKKFKSQKAAAKHFGVSDAMISAVLLGKKMPTKDLLAFIKCKKVVWFLESKDANS